VKVSVKSNPGCEAKHFDAHALVAQPEQRLHQVENIARLRLKAVGELDVDRAPREQGMS
jgi:hypothetical protein